MKCIAAIWVAVIATLIIIWLSAEDEWDPDNYREDLPTEPLPSYPRAVA